MKRRLAYGFLLLILTSCVKSSMVSSITPTQEPTPLFSQPDPTKQVLPPGTVAGVVVDEAGRPVPNAVVRLQTTENKTYTDESGRFKLENVPFAEPASITAWAEGFFINNSMASLDTPQITIEIHRFSQEDNFQYLWLPSGSSEGTGEDQGCAECHASPDHNVNQSLPVTEWLQDAHSQSAVNQRFLSTYNGTDIHGNQSPLTTFIPSNPTRRNSGDYNYIALAPNLERPFYGPGYKLDFPESAGNCATCHVPGAASRPGMGFAVEVNQVTGVELEGVFCDFCHKIWDIEVDPQTSLPFADRPGVLSYLFRRPPDGHQFFSGPYDDVAPGEDTYSAVQQESVFCAGCHSGVFWDNKIYNSYEEWMESPYSNPDSGQTCQDCHMPPLGVTYFALLEKGGLLRDPKTIFSHRMPGAMDEEFLQNAVSLYVEAKQQDREIQVSVRIVNDQTGHHVPTDYPGRQLILVIRAYDQRGNPLLQLSGPVLPDWCGVGDPEKGYYAGLPGEAYAKILQEDWTGYFPTVAYWTPTTIQSDNRIAAFETAASEYVFEAPTNTVVHIEAQIFLRRSFIEFLDWKAWDTPDILMEEAITVLE